MRKQNFSAVFRASRSRPPVNHRDTSFHFDPEVIQRLKKSLRDHPWEIFGVTLGIGALIGYRLGKNLSF